MKNELKADFKGKRVIKIVYRIGCMASGCTLLCLEDFVLRILNERIEIRDKYERLVFKDCVESHSQLRFCPGVDCHIVIKAQCQKAKKVTCTSCRISFWYVPNLQNLIQYSIML